MSALDFPTSPNVGQKYPASPAANRDRTEYEQWLTNGGVPNPYVPPEPAPPQPSQEATVLYDHENRLRILEGQPPVSLGDFVAKMTKPPPAGKK